MKQKKKKKQHRRASDIINIWSKGIAQKTDYPVQIQSKQLKRAATQTGTHFHNDLVVQYFLVHSKPFKLLLIGDLNRADICLGKLRLYSISPVGS